MGHPAVSLVPCRLALVEQSARWDPQPKGLEASSASSGQVFPFQMDSEPLPNEAWVKAYRSAAPRIQCLGPYSFI